MIRVRSVTKVKGFTVGVEFTDGTRRNVDLEPYFHGPVFEALRKDPALFAQIRIERGTLAWPNGADIDPEVLYGKFTPAWKEQPEKHRRDSRSAR